jgi:hypothetical protein
MAPNQQANMYFFVDRRMEIINYVQMHMRIQSAVKRVPFFSDMMAYIIPRSHHCDFSVLQIHAPTEDKIDDVKDAFYDELEPAFNEFHNPSTCTRPCSLASLEQKLMPETEIKKNVSGGGGVDGCHCIRLTVSLPSVTDC